MAVHNFVSRNGFKGHMRVDPPGGPPHDGGMDDLLRRVGDLEAEVKRIGDGMGNIVIPMLQSINERTKSLDERTKTLDERTKSLPTAREFGELIGKVSQLPTTVQLIGFVVAMLVASGLMKHFLP